MNKLFNDLIEITSSLFISLPTIVSSQNASKEAWRGNAALEVVDDADAEAEVDVEAWAEVDEAGAEVDEVGGEVGARAEVEARFFVCQSHMNSL